MLGSLLVQLTGYCHDAGHAAATPAGLMVLAAAALACVLAGLLARTARAGPAATVIASGASVAALRAQSLRTAFLRQRDPRAAGRVHPRAPTAGRAAG